MLDIFQMHSEGKIGIKCLTEADLGLGKSHQTHIGLYGEVLSYLPDHGYSEKGLLFYNHTFNFVTMLFDRITNSDGTTRSPKFRLGDMNTISLVGRIREIVQDAPCANWHLLWFGIDNGSVFSILFNDKDEIFKSLANQGIVNSANNKRVVSSADACFSSLNDILQVWVYANMQGSLGKMELSVLSQRSLSKEELYLERILNFSERSITVYHLAITHLYHYLESQKQQGAILGYELSSQTGGQARSYIFTIIKKNGESKTMLLKATEFDVKQLFMLGIEDLQLMYATPSNSPIGIFRLFKVESSGCMLQICNSLPHLVSQVLDPISAHLGAMLQDDFPFMGINLGIVVSKYPSNFSQIIKLPK